MEQEENPKGSKVNPMGIMNKVESQIIGEASKEGGQMVEEGSMDQEEVLTPSLVGVTIVIKWDTQPSNVQRNKHQVPMVGKGGTNWCKKRMAIV